MNGKIVLVDVDHTLSDAAWRDHMLGSDWDAYHAESVHDKLKFDIARLVHSLHKMEHPIVGLTGRPEKWRALTTQWMLRHGVPMHDLIMRPDDCYLPNAECKITMAKACYGPELAKEILMIIDDNEEVIKTFHAEGITCLHVYGGTQWK